jgi:hypothetical protein
MGVVFLLLAGLGFAAPGLAAIILAHARANLTTDNWLHLMTSLGFIYFGLAPGLARAKQA